MGQVTEIEFSALDWDNEKYVITSPKSKAIYFYPPNICNSKNCDRRDNVNLVVDKLHFQFNFFIEMEKEEIV